MFCSNSIRLYIDGHIVQQSITNSYNPNPIFSLDSLDAKVVGANQSGLESCDVKIDELRVWSRALSDMEVQERLGDNIDINLDITGEQSNNVGKLEGYWKFDSLSLRNEVTNILRGEPIGVYRDPRVDTDKLILIKYKRDKLIHI